MKSPIKIAHVHLETPLIVSDEFVQLLIIENPSEFYSMVLDLSDQFNGEDGIFVFSCENQIISASKRGVMVGDLFNFDLNDKKVLNLLYKQIESVVIEKNVVFLNELNAKLISLIDEISYELPFALEYSEPQTLDYIKIANVKFSKNYDSLQEKIVCYINALIELKKCDFFVFVNLKSVLDDDKLLQIYSHCKNEGVGLLLVESMNKRKFLNGEKAIIITEDLCEILANYQ